MNLSTVMQNRINVVKQKQLQQLDSKKEYLDIDLLYENLSDLVNPNYRLWYCKKFNQIGRERVMILASQARADGKDSIKLFSHLIKKEIKS